MKNKIKRLSKGDFHIPQPEIIFPETRIIMRIREVSHCRIREREASEVWCILLPFVWNVRNKGSMETR